MGREGDIICGRLGLEASTAAHLVRIQAHTYHHPMHVHVARGACATAAELRTVLVLRHLQQHVLTFLPEGCAISSSKKKTRWSRCTEEHRKTERYQPFVQAVEVTTKKLVGQQQQLLCRCCSHVVALPFRGSSIYLYLHQERWQGQDQSEQHNKLGHG